MAGLLVTTTIGADTTIDDAALEAFKASLRGELLRPGDPGYDDARKVWNGMIDKRPALIARCTGVADIIDAVNFARTNELLVSVRGGGHSFPGSSVCDGGIVIDLSRMKSVRVNPGRHIARAEPGVKWGEFDQETQAFGLATTGGTLSDTGIAGLTLGGGIGWICRKHGLTVDNLLSVDIVTADGQFRTASATENPDLFWGVRGGSGNFGIVTSFQYQLHPVGQLLAGMVIHPMDKAREALRFYQEYASAAPDELMTGVGLMPSSEGQPVVAIIVCYSGSIEMGEEVLRPIREFGPPVADHIGPMAYAQVQGMLDAAFPAGRRNYIKSNFMNSLDDAAIGTLVDRFRSVSSPYSMLALFQLGGAAGRVGKDETAFYHRDAGYHFFIVSIWEDAAGNGRNIRWAQETWDAMRPFSADGVYVNEMGDEQEGEARIREAYGPTTYQRLVALKNKYDPTNFFRLNPNIKPTV